MNLEFLRSKKTHIIFIIVSVCILLTYLGSYIAFAIMYADSVLFSILDIFFATIAVIGIAPYWDRKNVRFYMLEWKWGLPIYALLMAVFVVISVVVTFGTLTGTIYFVVMIPLYLLVCVYVILFSLLAIHLDQIHVGVPVEVVDGTDLMVTSME